MAEGLVTLDRVAQDGMKVRASAGAASFRRQPTLEEALAEAEEHLTAAEAGIGRRSSGEQDPLPGGPAAGGRGTGKRIQRGWSSCRRSPRARRRKTATRRGPRPPMRTARVMKMGDGGFRPAFNVQLATATDSQVITGVDVTNSGGDQGQLAPMVEQHGERYERETQGSPGRRGIREESRHRRRSRKAVRWCTLR